MTYSKYDPENTVLAGFSYGAMTCLVAATQRNPSELWLFSLSPYFAEDIRSKNMNQSWLNNIGYRRVTVFNKLNFKDLADKINCKTLLFSGEIELSKWSVLQERVVLARTLLKNNIQTIVPSAGHDVSEPHDIKAIFKVI